VTEARASHADLDEELRRAKARKIAAILGPGSLRGARVLEIGTGSGVISAELAQLVSSGGSLDSVDVVDERIETAGYRFTHVTGTALPFDDGSFDLVISNHVIEHVGAEPDQAAHLREIARTLAANGRYYLATPSRVSIVEPHFHLPFLSWLPQGASDAYVRATGRGSHYDCRLLTRTKLKRLLTDARLTADDRSLDAVRLFAQEARAGRLARVVGRIPPASLRPLRGAIPTMIFVGGRASAA
jgi:SAM-dependent methyltransferase